MTAAEFDALATLARLRAGPQREAVRLHLVDGVPRLLAAQTAGCGTDGLHHTLTAVRRHLARVALGLEPPTTDEEAPTKSPQEPRNRPVAPLAPPPR